MLGSDSGLSPGIQQLCRDREKVEELFLALKQGDEERSLQLLEGASAPGEIGRLAWAKDGANGAYPVHFAVRKGMVHVAEFLAKMPGVLSQKDCDRLTACDVCEDMRVSELLCRIRAEARASR
mmetsp:Transcript_1524/g.4414  ORF Transcript_1524/g.4414 Transcript_1524/m.4414 type:complete len:123 (+) Transcript_1524:587-955(+)